MERKLIKFAAKVYGVELRFAERGGHIYGYIGDVCLNSAANRNRGYSVSGKAKSRFEVFVKDDLRRVYGK